MKLQKGDIVRYAIGPTSLARIHQNDAIGMWYGRQYFGSIIGFNKDDLTPATKEEIGKYLQAEETQEYLSKSHREKRRYLQRKGKRMNLNELALKVTKVEGGKESISNAQVKEVISSLGYVLSKESVIDAALIFAKILEKGSTKGKK